MDRKDINIFHSSNDRSISNFNFDLFSSETSANADNNGKNYKRVSMDEISTSKPQKLKIAADALDQEQDSDIYKLPFELLADLLDYLPLKDLCAVRQTSKWFHQVAGFCFQRNYSAIKRCINLNREDIELSVFHQLIQTVWIHGDRLVNNEYEYYLNRVSEFKQLKTMAFNCHLIEIHKAEGMKKMLDKIECLTIQSGISKKVAENIPILFPNLKRLRIQHVVSKSEWIDFNCQHLESFELMASFDVVAIGPFLEMNPNIRKLAINLKVLLDNKESLKAAKLPLEELVINMSSYKSTDTELTSICQLLNELHEAGAYQRLKLYVFCDHEDFNFIEFASLSALIKLYVVQTTYKFDHPLDDKYPYSERFALSTFRSLQEISVNYSYDINDIEATADNLKSLERIRFVFADPDDIMPLIKRARNLSKITVSHFIHTASRVKRTNEKVYWTYTADSHADDYLLFEEKKVINLLSLNAERSRLSNAKMITLYVNEDVYLATKWMMKQTEFEFIQMKRISSFEPDYDFECSIPIQDM